MILVSEVTLEQELERLVSMERPLRVTIMKFELNGVSQKATCFENIVGIKKLRKFE
jgi:hypothetical protein